MLLTIADFDTHIYSEIVNEIVRDNDVLVEKAILRAEAEAKSYLNRYDTATMFGGGFHDDFLKSLCLDIACWQLCKLANPNISLELFRTAYEDAIKFLQHVQKGGPDPQWPLKPNDPQTPIDEAGNVEFSAQPKRQNHF